LKTLKEQSETVNWRRTGNAIAKRIEKTKGQTMVTYNFRLTNTYPVISRGQLRCIMISLWTVFWMPRVEGEIVKRSTIIVIKQGTTGYIG